MCVCDREFANEVSCQCVCVCVNKCNMRCVMSMCLCVAVITTVISYFPVIFRPVKQNISILGGELGVANCICVLMQNSQYLCVVLFLVNKMHQTTFLHVREKRHGTC